MNEARTRVCLSMLALAFVVVGVLFIPRFGIEVDEALITNGIYPHGAPLYSWHIGAAEIPVMMMSYLGALKTWMYNVIFLVFPPGPMPLRLPTVVLAAVSLVLFFRFLDRAVSRRAAWIAAALLATDPTYLMMNTIDFGPVTFQFLFKLAALVLLVKFHQKGSRAVLAGAFFLLGLALWDKAIFAWVIAGLALGTIVAFPGELRRYLSIRNLLIAAGAGIAGALPLIIYNIARPFETLRANAAPESLAVWGKSIILWRSIDGSVLFGFFTRLDPGQLPGVATSWYQTLSIVLGEALGRPRESWMLYATGLAVLALPFLWRSSARKPMLFALGACIGTWIPMILTAGAGAAAHHVLLLWPFHLMMIAVALDQIRLHAVPVTIASLLCLSNVVVVNQYYADVIVNGPAMRWSDALPPLHARLEQSRGSRIYFVDWGMIETITLLSEGKLAVSYPDATREEELMRALLDPQAIFVGHSREEAILPQQRAALEALAEREHYTEEPVTIVYDRNGRPAFDVFRFRKLHL